MGDLSQALKTVKVPHVKTSLGGMGLRGEILLTLIHLLL